VPGDTHAHGLKVTSPATYNTSGRVYAANLTHNIMQLRVERPLQLRQHCTACLPPNTCRCQQKQPHITRQAYALGLKCVPSPPPITAGIMPKKHAGQFKTSPLPPGKETTPSIR
jgi:hypothetical protein